MEEGRPPWDDDPRWNDTIRRALLAAGGRDLLGTYRAHHLKLALLRQPTQVWLAADVGLGLATQRYEGEQPILTVDWWPWRDVQEPGLHVVSELHEGDAVDEIRFTVQRPRVELYERGKPGLALSMFAGAVMRAASAR